MRNSYTMSLNVHGLANKILTVLLQQKPDFEYLEGRQLIKELKMLTGDRYEPHQIMDSIEYLERNRDVETICSPRYDRITWNWEKVTITLNGIDKIKADPELYLSDKQNTGNISQHVNIYGNNMGPISQAGIGNIEIEWENVENEIEIAPDLTSDQKEIILDNARVIKEEGKKTKKNESRLRDAAKKIIELTKPPLRDLILGVGGNALYDLIILLISVN